MTVSMTFKTHQRSNSALLVGEIAARVTTPFSMASGQDDTGYFVRVTTDAPLEQSDIAAIEAALAAHNPDKQTPEQVKRDHHESVLVDVSVADVRGLISDFDSAATATQIKAALRPILVLLLKAAVVSGSIGADQMVNDA